MNSAPKPSPTMATFIFLLIVFAFGPAPSETLHARETLKEMAHLSVFGGELSTQSSGLDAGGPGPRARRSQNSSSADLICCIAAVSPTCSRQGVGMFVC